MCFFQLLRILNKINLDPSVHGIIVQMPLDSVNVIDSTLITDSVNPSKDVDGLNTINQGKLAVGDLTSGFLPCTPNGCMELIKRYSDILLSREITFMFYLIVEQGYKLREAKQLLLDGVRLSELLLPNF